MLERLERSAASLIVCLIAVLATTALVTGYLKFTPFWAGVTCTAAVFVTALAWVVYVMAGALVDGCSLVEREKP